MNDIEQIIDKLANECTEPFTCEKCKQKSVVRRFVPKRGSSKLSVVCPNCYMELMMKFWGVKENEIWKSH